MLPIYSATEMAAMCKGRSGGVWYETVQRFYRAGMTITEIARTMNVSRNTVSKDVRAEGFPERPQSTRSGYAPPLPCASGSTVAGRVS